MTVIYHHLLSHLWANIDHSGRDWKSHLFRHVLINYHRNASYDDFEIIGSGFRNNTFKRKVAEAIFVNKGIMTNCEGSGEVGWAETF